MTTDFMRDVFPTLSSRVQLMYRFYLAREKRLYALSDKYLEQKQFAKAHKIVDVIDSCNRRVYACVKSDMLRRQQDLDNTLAALRAKKAA